MVGRDQSKIAADWICAVEVALPKVPCLITKHGAHVLGLGHVSYHA